MNQEIALTHEDIINFPFLYKVFLVASSTEPSVEWLLNETEIKINIGEFENFLNDEKSIFKCKKFSTFSQTMSFCGFDQNQVKTSETIFKHKHFQKNRLDLITKLINSLSDKEFQERFVGDETKLNYSILRRQTNGDPCLKGLYSLQNIEKHRLSFETRLAFCAESLNLQKKIKESDKNVSENQGNFIELPVELFENPQESVSGFEEHRCYAGFYGDAKTSDIRNFFDDYLPVYANQEYDERMFKDDDEDSKATEVVEPPSLEEASRINFNFSAESLKVVEQSPPETPKNSLEPIFTPEADEDLSMEDFLKFKENKDKEEGKDAELESKEAEDEVKDKSEEKKEGDQNFFNQYRESINLLYDGTN
ncbi:hypothetical protein ACFFRR_001564 [Megaselia abdita]